MSISSDLDPSLWLQNHGDVLYRYALARVRSPHTAEDLVQDTFLAALKGAQSFSGRSAERTWLVGVLKHKIIDHFRKHKRMFLQEDLETREPDPENYLDRKGTWKVGQSAWITQPEKAAERTEFWQALNGCLDKLNERQRAVFVLRELQEQDAEDICSSLDISLSNLWVLLHRARLQLKSCLEHNWTRAGARE
jgi:RNA polymerase sigma-70 factor (TIGR02943 family)